LLGKPQETLPPDWIQDLRLPYVDQYNDEINKRESEIDEISVQIKQLKDTKSKILEYTKLLYCDGKELEDIFKNCLTKLGGKVDPAKYADEEYCLTYEGKEFPVEAKGVSKSIALTHLRQLIDYMLKYDEATNEKTKGILLGNPWKNKPLADRNLGGTPNFPDNVIQRAMDMNIALVSSVDFFKVFCEFLEEKVSGDDILKKITSGTGLVDFSIS
jgi:hypothetical protein